MRWAAFPSQCGSRRRKTAAAAAAAAGEALAAAAAGTRALGRVLCGPAAPAPSSSFFSAAVSSSCCRYCGGSGPGAGGDKGGGGRAGCGLLGEAEPCKGGGGGRPAGAMGDAADSRELRKTFLVPAIKPFDHYDFARAKIACNLAWLVAKAFGTGSGVCGSPSPSAGAAAPWAAPFPQ